MRLPNYVAASWQAPADCECAPIVNPATGETLAYAPLSSAAEVDRAVRAGAAAFCEWRRTPVTERVQFLFKFRQLLEENVDSLARRITLECGKTLAEARAELRRGIENVETACGMPLMMQGCNNEDISRGVDEHLLRQPLGVVAAIAPFNFPAMIPLWFLPYAIAAGNCFVLKPSEKVAGTAVELFELLARTELPPGVAQLVHGGRQTVEALLDHPDVQAISFVGSTPAARYVYGRAAAAGKRAQCQGGAKNPAIVFPDADLALTTQIVADSAFGCAGQRCLAASVAVTVGEARAPFTAAICEAAAARRVGCGLDEGVDMGPVISRDSQARIETLVDRGLAGGANPLLDGRGRKPRGYEAGAFVYPTVLDAVSPDNCLAHEEVFGPVLGLVHAATVDDAIEFVNRSAHGNMACVFTSSGATARRFRHEALVGNLGVNVGVAAPMAFFPFSGWKASFFGDLHAQGRHAVEFYTQTKVVVERWHDEWSRRF